MGNFLPKAGNFLRPVLARATGVFVLALASCSGETAWETEDLVAACPKDTRARIEDIGVSLLPESMDGAHQAHFEITCEDESDGNEHSPLALYAGEPPDQQPIPGAQLYEVTMEFIGVEGNSHTPQIDDNEVIISGVTTDSPRFNITPLQSAGA